MMTLQEAEEAATTALTKAFLQRILGPSLFDLLPVRDLPPPTWDQRLERLVGDWASELMTCKHCGCDGWAHEDDD